MYGCFVDTKTLDKHTQLTARLQYFRNVSVLRRYLMKQRKVQHFDWALSKGKDHAVVHFDDTDEAFLLFMITDKDRAEIQAYIDEEK